MNTYHLKKSIWRKNLEKRHEKKEKEAKATRDQRFQIRAGQKI